MSKFLTPLDCRKVEGTSDTWQTLTDFQYQSDIGGLITVPAWYKTDFASTPWYVWSIAPKDGIWDDIAVVHDFLYGGKVFDRAKCDAIFLEGLKVLGVPAWKAYAMWGAVRLFGQKYYDGAPTP